MQKKPLCAAVNKDEWDTMEDTCSVLKVYKFKNEVGIDEKYLNKK